MLRWRTLCMSTSSCAAWTACVAALRAVDAALEAEFWASMLFQGPSAHGSTSLILRCCSKTDSPTVRRTFHRRFSTPAEPSPSEPSPVEPSIVP